MTPEFADPMWNALRAQATTPEAQQIVGMDEATGTIGLLFGDPGKPICMCGATNFTSCDSDGAPMSVSGERRRVERKRMGIRTKKWEYIAWPGLFSCNGCGRVVSAETRRTIQGEENK